MKPLNLLLLLITLHIAAIAQTQPGYRLMSIEANKQDALLYYSSNRGGTIADNDFHNWLDTVVSEPTSFGLDISKLVLLLSTGNYNPTLLYDSVKTTLPGGNSGRITGPSYYQWFDNAGRLVARTNTKDNGSDSFSWNGNALVERMFVSGTTKRKYLYDAGGRITSDTIYSKQNNNWLKKGQTTYRYNLLGMLESKLSTFPFKLMVYEYSGTLCTRALQIDSVIKDTIDAYVYTYGPAGELYEIVRSYLPGPGVGNLELKERHIYTYAPASRDVSRQLFNKNNQTWESAGHIVTTKNLFDLIAFAHVGKSLTFNYEHFWNTAIDDGTYTLPGLTAYPSPANDVITIETSFTTPQLITASITDMQGRLMRSWSEPSTKEYSRTIPVADLPTGNYVLKVNGLVKRFVVR